jgi:hypothetical protein
MLEKESATQRRNGMRRRRQSANSGALCGDSMMHAKIRCHTAPEQS